MQVSSESFQQDFNVKKEKVTKNTRKLDLCLILRVTLNNTQIQNNLQ